jgi:dipeptidase D
MLNLDSAEEDTVIVGCCGGLRHEMTVPVTFEVAEGEGISISLGGLCGGHSGEDIHRGRLNAHVLMGKLLAGLAERTDFRLASLSGGEKENAIPRECEAVILPADPKAARDYFEVMTVKIREEIKTNEDKGLFLQLETVAVSRATTFADTKKLLRLLSIPNGVLLWREEPQYMPHLSRNLARIRTEEGAVTVALSSRCSDAEKIAASKEELEALAAELGGKVGHYSPYPGWESALDARLVRVWQAAFTEVTGRHVQPTLIHAGLETGLITAAVKGLEAIAVGCNIHNLHTPVERMELSSFARIYRVVLAFLEKVC